MKAVYLYDRLDMTVKENIDAVEFRYEDGTASKVYPFESQEYSFTYDERGYELVKACGVPQRHIRYTPSKLGKLTARFLAGDKERDIIFFDVLPSENHGYIKVSECNAGYFEYSDSTPFIPIGINTVYPTSYDVSAGNEFGITDKKRYIGVNQYRSWFKKASENGVNVARLWLGDDYFSPSTQDGYTLNGEGFAKIDKVIELAREYGIALKLTIDKFRSFCYDRELTAQGYGAFIHSLFNTQLFVDGQPCESMNQFLTNETFTNAWLYKVGEIAKRYAGDTAVFAIELWNEMNAVGASYETMLAWNEKYLPRIKEMFPLNMVINSLGSLDCDRAREQYLGFCWDKFAFKQVHRYLDCGAPDKICHDDIIELIYEGVNILNDNKAPVIVAETGAVNDCHSGSFRYYSADDDGIIFADCVYTPFFAGSAGCGQIWHWDARYVEAKGLYKMFKPFKQLTDGIDTLSENFLPRIISNELAHILLLDGNEHILGYVRNKSASWKTLLRDLKNVRKIKELCIEIGSAGELELIKIWDDEAFAVFENGKLLLQNLGNGVMFKLRKEKT